MNEKAGKEFSQKNQKVDAWYRVALPKTTVLSSLLN